MLFDKKISVLIPFKPDGGYRDKNWNWLRKRYELMLPNAEICLGNYEKEPFSRARAINNAAKKATRNIFIIADSDIVFDINQISEAILGLGSYAWMIPYTSINYLSFKDTELLQKLNPNQLFLNKIKFSDYTTVDCSWIYGGICIVPREYFEQVGGFDERFVGWGAEDDAFQRSLDYICGHHGRIKTSLWHMYHPIADKQPYKNNHDLLDKYYGDYEIALQTIQKKLKHKCYNWR